MNREDIIRMAREAGIGDSHGYIIKNELPNLEAFAELVRADEREKWMERTAILIRGERGACASECDEWIKNGSVLAEDIAAAIRARSNT